ncbi:MAG: acyl carrier protein [Oligoflexia bacterium]|nr:acyl carrier protein [Oligoflexia bacterium]
MLTAVHQARIYAILTELTAIPADEIKSTDRLREDLGMDSVTRMELVSMLAEEFDIDIELEEAVAIEDVGGVVSLAGQRLSDD